MNDNAIKNFATWARRELLSEVSKKCSFWGISDGDCPAANADSIDGRVLTSLEKRQRADLLKKASETGLEQLVETAAYTWFNRLLAIRFMEVNDRLPSHVRVLSGDDGSFSPQVLREALDLPLDALDGARALELVQAGDDEALFKLIFLAQCDQLAECMPAVFDRIGSSMELLLPDGLLRKGGVVEQLVTSIPEDDWMEGVEIIGWMYQYYVSERKDEVFASFKKGKKAERDAIAPATQLFTPNWIVRYLTENSLGRLWVLNHPESSLPGAMPYFISPGEDAEKEFKRISSPEEISVVDPACGSGHILVYAFDLLAAIYAEAGYSDREAARLIVEKNISGLEIDPRAAAMASFAVTMKACELDSRFLRRGVNPRITVLSRVEFTSEEKALMPRCRENLQLLDAAAHLDECGSLFKPSSKDMADIERDLASLAGEGSLFADAARDKLGRLQAELQPLAERYDVVVANPPYMGSSSLGKWNGRWIKDNFPEAYRDLCTSFIDRGFTLSNDQGYSAMVTMQSWMFLGSYEKLRDKLLRNHTISSMAHLGTRAFGAIGGEVVSTTATVFASKKHDVPGTYLRLVDMQSEEAKREGALEALANPDCGWLYLRSGSDYAVIDGAPIAYWLSPGYYKLLSKKERMEDSYEIGSGLSTSDNERFLRRIWEVSFSKISSGKTNDAKWSLFQKGRLR
ncbi:MAG: BREX-1 system adenine-specific DNA-methyltransferase PglX [Collinsella sp.]|nr:BREX-1 system adenine-specific DNA-methyltransferase PglX [Collinsella sp.]